MNSLLFQSLSRISKLYISVVLLCIMSATTADADEIVTLPDGRVIKLNENGSYRFIKKSHQDQDSYVKILEPKFKITYESQKIRAVRCMPRFENVQPKTILGIKFSATFVNSFGDTIYEFSSIHENKLNYKEYTTTTLSFAFKEMLDRDNEPFEKLLPLVESENATISIVVDSISFEDRTIVDFR